MIKTFENYNKNTAIIKELRKINETYISATDMLKLPEIKKQIKFEEIDVYYYISDEYNYKEDTYFHVLTQNEEPYAGVGRGLYLGRDEKALMNFYDIEDQGYEITEYHMKPKWFSIMKDESWDKFKKAFEDNGEKIINSYLVSEIFLEMGYDGIRYYDINATGEEFVYFGKEYQEYKKIEKSRDFNL